VRGACKKKIGKHCSELRDKGHHQVNHQMSNDLPGGGPDEDWTTSIKEKRVRWSLQEEKIPMQPGKVHPTTGKKTKALEIKRRVGCWGSREGRATLHLGVAPWGQRTLGKKGEGIVEGRGEMKSHGEQRC